MKLILVTFRRLSVEMSQHVQFSATLQKTPIFEMQPVKNHI